MSTPTTNPVAWHEASSYAAAVRVHLDDLAPDVVEELAGGLEADLLDQAAETDQPLTAVLGDPSAYASELRSAAGLPPRAHRTVATPGSWLAAWRDVVRSLRAQPWWPQLARVGRELRPGWWVLRAWIAFQFVHGVLGGAGGVLPTSVLGFLTLVAFVGLSYALGRGLWSRVRGVRGLVVTGNVLAVLLLPFAVDAAQRGAYADTWSEPAPYSYESSGLVSEGRTVTNVFPYGPDGEPLTGVTLLDQDGEPLSVDPGSMPGEDVQGDGSRLRVQVPGWTADGDVAWNVFPMGTAQVPTEEFYGTYYSEADRPGSALRPPYRRFEEAVPPRLRVPDTLADPSRGFSSQPTPSASSPAPVAPAPSPTDVPTPTDAPVPTPTP